MSYNSEANRATGRSTFTLIAALMAHEAGKNVFIVGADAAHLLTLEREFYSVVRRLGREPMNPKLKNIRYLTVHEIDTVLPDFSWEAGLRGSGKNQAVFIDHFSIESRFAWLLREMHRFDKEKS